MALTRLSCPDCGTVLKPAKPVEAGKKVKCPKCAVIFVAAAERDRDDDDDDRPRKKAKAAPAKKAAVKEKEKPKEETYGYIRDPDEDDEDKKPKINYAPDESVKDLRGPAIVLVTKPANFLQLVGMAAVLGWIVLFVFVLIPTVFPVLPDRTEVDARRNRGDAKKKEDEEKAAKAPRFFKVYDLDIGEYFLVLMVPMILGAVYSAFSTAGGIKMQNLESRPFAMTGAIMAMLPIHTMGIGTASLMVIQWLLNLLFEDPQFSMTAGSVVAGLLYMISLGVGIWALVTLNNEDVKAGFEYKSE